MSALDNLKREAKRWLKALRAGDAEARARLQKAVADAPQSPILRDVQHALAREHGFAGWAALKEELAKNPAAPSGEALVQRYERMAANLLEAYRTGSADALQRHWNDTWHRRNWHTMRRYVQLDLGRRPESHEGEAGPGHSADTDISLDDARLLVAREHGFESWQELRQRTLTSPPTPGRDAELDVDALEEQRATIVDAHGRMTDELLERISRFEHVTTLRLGGSSALTDQGLRHLRRMTQLREIDLSGCNVTDVGIAVLAHCERLEHVDLRMTNTGDGAIHALVGKVKLRHLKSGNRVTDAALPRLHEFPVFKTWQNGDTRLSLLSPDADPNSLLLRGTITDRGLAHLAGLDGLFGLNVDDRNLAITAAGLAPLATLPHLGFLAFDATDEAMPLIAAMPALRHLMCQDTTTSDDGFVALSRSRTIEYIWGRRCYNLHGRGFAALANMPSLRGLSVSCKNVDDAGLAALPSFLGLRELMPMDVSDAGFRYVGQCEQLESLILMYCRDTTDVATEHIRGLPRLTRYFASYTRITDRTPEILSGMASLEEIELHGCPMVTNAGVATLARLPRLRELVLDGMQSVTREVMAGFPAPMRVKYSP